MNYKVTLLHSDGRQQTEVINGIPDYAAMTHMIDHCQIQSFIVSPVINLR